VRNFIAGITAAIAVAVAAAVIIWTIVLPRINSGADQKPSEIETAAARNILSRWVRRNAGSASNPLTSSRESLSAARTEYEAHCAICHRLDGSGRNQLEADFAPPVAKLTGGVQQLSDGEIYFIIAKGIRNTAMPSFGENHSPDDMWRAVLWVRHLAHLTPRERTAIETQMKAKISQHESTMSH
jgi:mono/diheme cytochrome c family protein